MSLVLAGVNAGFGTRRVLAGVDLSVAGGEILGVVGPNGAGKSTMLKLLTRQLRPLAGNVSLDGRELSTFNRFELARQVAVVAQSPTLPAGFTALEVIAMGRTPHLGLFGTFGARDAEAVERAARITGLSDLLGRRIGSLSGGERQRVALARALAQESDYLLLDEPTNHLDLRFQVEVVRLARAHVAAGGGALAVLHDLNLAARVCDRLVLLSAGQVVANGTAEEVLTAELLSSVYQTPVSVERRAGRPLVVLEL